jgi:hypothetical protein
LARIQPTQRWRRLAFQSLEQRLVLATFADSGTTLSLGLGTGEKVAIISTGSTYILSLDTTGTWSGVNDANVTGTTTNILTVTNAGLTAFTSSVQITDTGSGGGDAIVFNDSLASGYSNNFVIDLTNSSSGAATPGLAFDGASLFTGSAGLTASVNGDIIVNSTASITSSGSPINLMATGTNAPLTDDGNIISNSGSITLQASGAVTVGNNVTINSGTGSLALAADVAASGSGDDGVGILTVSAGATVVSYDTAANAITLRGADVNIDTSSNPAVVGAVRTLSNTTYLPPGYGFVGPEYLAFDSSGDLFVSDLNTTEVQEYAPGATTPFADFYYGDGPMAFDSSGDLFISNDGYGRVTEYPAGSTSPIFLQGLNDPAGIAVDSQGDVFVADAGSTTVDEFAPGATRPTAYLGGLDAPRQLAFDSHGDLFVANTGGTTVSEFLPGSTTPTSTPLSGLQAPWGLAFDSAGDLFVANSGGNTISEFAPGATTATETLSGLSGPFLLAFDSYGTLYASNPGANTVCEFAGGSTTPTTTLGGLATPRGVAVSPSGDLFVANTGGSGEGNSVSEFSPGTSSLNTTPTAGGVVVQSSIESRPMQIGGSNNGVVAGINLTSAELGEIETLASGTLTLGDSGQIGDISVSAARPTTTFGAALDVLQSTAGAGQIVLDEGASDGTALYGNGGTVSLTAGTGGIQTTLLYEGLPLETVGFAAGGSMNIALGFAPTSGTKLTIVDNTAAAGDLINGAFSNLPQAGIYTASYLGTPYTFQVNYQGGDGNDLVLTEVQSTGPTVIGAYVNGSAWSASYLSMLDAAGLGSPAASGQGFQLADGAHQLTNMLPWTNVTQISIAFNEAVNLSQSSLTLYNSANAAIASSSYSYNNAAFIATWQFSTPLSANKYVMNLAAGLVTDTNGSELDGQWTTSVSTFAAGSGNGAPGSDFNFYFNVLPGDANSSGTVTNGDVLDTKLQVGAMSNSNNYLLDVNATGNITNGDVLLEKLQVGSNINTFPAPQLPPQSAPAAVPANTVPANTVPANTVPANTAPMNTAPMNTVTMNTVTMNTVTDEATPDDVLFSPAAPTIAIAPGGNQSGSSVVVVSPADPIDSVAAAVRPVSSPPAIAEAGKVSLQTSELLELPVPASVSEPTGLADFALAGPFSVTSTLGSSSPVNHWALDKVYSTRWSAADEEFALPEFDSADFSPAAARRARNFGSEPA